MSSRQKSLFFSRRHATLELAVLVHQSVRPLVRLSACPSVCPSIRLFIRLYPNKKVSIVLLFRSCPPISDCGGEGGCLCGLVFCIFQVNSYGMSSPPIMNQMHLTSSAEKTQDEHMIHGGHPTLGSHLNRGNPMKPEATPCNPNQPNATIFARCFLQQVALGFGFCNLRCWTPLTFRNQCFQR